jgi:hypothetical protein
VFWKRQDSLERVSSEPVWLKMAQFSIKSYTPDWQRTKHNRV